MVFTSPGQIIQPSKSEVLINCIVTPKSTAKIRWEKDGKAVSFFKAGGGKVNGHKYVYPNGSLFISALRKRDIGIYTCIASTKRSKQSATAAVAIACKFSFVFHIMVMVEKDLLMHVSRQYTMYDEKSLKCHGCIWLIRPVLIEQINLCNT